MTRPSAYILTLDREWHRASHACGAVVYYSPIGRATARKLVDQVLGAGYFLPRVGYELYLSNTDEPYHVGLINRAGKLELQRWRQN